LRDTWPRKNDSGKRKRNEIKSKETAPLPTRVLSKDRGKTKCRRKWAGSEVPSITRRKRKKMCAKGRYELGKMVGEKNVLPYGLSRRNP